MSTDSIWQGPLAGSLAGGLVVLALLVAGIVRQLRKGGPIAGDGEEASGPPAWKEIVITGLEGSRYEGKGVVEVAKVLVEALSAMGAPSGGTRLVTVARATQEVPPGGRQPDDVSLWTMRTVTGQMDGIASVGEPIVRLVAGTGWRAVIAVSLTLEAKADALEACAQSVIEAAPQVAEVLLVADAGEQADR